MLRAVQGRERDSIVSASAEATAPEFDDAEKLS